MFIKAQPAARRSGYTLVEVMFAMGIFSIAGAALMSLFFCSITSLAAMSNYSELDRDNREALDLMTREIREAHRVISYTTNSITLEDGATGGSLTYAFNSGPKTLTRSLAGTTKVLLNDCTVLQFNLAKRNPKDGTYDVYPVATTIDTAKVINLTWQCRRTSLRGRVTSENVQTARIVIRKQ